MRHKPTLTASLAIAAISTSLGNTGVPSFRYFFGYTDTHRRVTSTALHVCGAVTCPFFSLTEDEIYITEGAAKKGITYKNTSTTEPLVLLRYFGPDTNPDAPNVGDYRKNKK